MTHDEKLLEIQEHPERHKHAFGELMECCKVGGAIDTSLMEAHEKYVELGSNGGRRCDVAKGPCSCGAWH